MDGEGSPAGRPPMIQQTTVTVEVTVTYDDEMTTEHDAQMAFLDTLPEPLGRSAQLHSARITAGLVDADGVPEPAS